MHKRLILVVMAGILLAMPMIFAESLEVQLYVDGLDPVDIPEIYEGHEIPRTFFLDYSFILIDLAKSPKTFESFSSGDFLAKITDADGEELSRMNFEPNFLGEASSDVVTLNLEYSDSAEYLEVYMGEEQKMKESIGELLCNSDSVCDAFENYLSCPTDCSLYSEDGLCNGYSGDNYCDADCYADEDCGTENCNDGVLNQDETGVDQGGVCDQEDCTLKELSGEMTCGDGVCDASCENVFSCETDCSTNTCVTPFFKVRTSCSSQSEIFRDWRANRISINNLMRDIRDYIFPSLE
ncbi:hypothetical protein HN997_04455 [archaeon]|nr:hypothetical protein [archaeon]